MNDAFFAALPLLPETEAARAFRRAAETLRDDPNHPGHASIRRGEAHWLFPKMGLRQLALDMGASALAAGDTNTAALVAKLIVQTGAAGPRLDRFVADAAPGSADKEIYGGAAPRQDAGTIRRINAEFFAALELLPQDEAAQAFRRAAELLRDDPGHPGHDRIIRGEAHWFMPEFGLGDQAVALGAAALSAGALETATVLANLIEKTNAYGPKALRFITHVSAANCEWGLARMYRQRMANQDKSVKQSPRRWESEERIFNEISGILAEQGLEWLDLSPARSRVDRLGALETLIKSWIAAGRIGDPAHRPILDRYARLRRTQIAPSATADADPHNVRMMRTFNFRNYVAGKRVCLIANSTLLLKHQLGEMIDAYDTVVRFNSYVIDPPRTGSRTDVHACVHLYRYNLEAPVDVRIMVSGRRDLWRRSVHEKIVPGAQKWLGDGSLSWPARDLGLIDATSATRTPTVGFNIMRTLVDYGVCEAIDLIGFDFYASGMLRLSEAMSVAHSKAHNSTAEKEWIMSHAQSVDETIIRMI